MTPSRMCLLLCWFGLGALPAGCAGDDPPAPSPGAGGAPRNPGRGGSGGGSSADAGPTPAGDAAGDGPADGTAGDGGDTAASSDGGAPIPSGLAISALMPATVARSTALTLQVLGSDFAETAAVWFDGQAQPTMRQSSTRLTINLTAAQTEQAGFHSLFVTNVMAGEPSAVVYLYVPPGPAWPEVLDINPDNAEVGQTVRIVGFNISGETLRIADASGRQAGSGRIGTVPGNNQLLETVEFVVPSGWQSGPMVIATAVGTFRAKIFNVGKNLTTLPGTKLTASSEYGEEWTIARGADNDIFTSWFTAEGDCVSRGPMVCMKSPWFMISFAEPQTVRRISLRGNREYVSGYDFLQGRFEILGANQSVLWSSSRLLPEPDRDLDIVLGAPVSGAIAVRFHSERDESADPGFGELEVFGP